MILFFIVITAIVSTQLVSGVTDFPKAALVVVSLFVIIATFINTDIGLIAILLSMLLSPELEAGSVPGRSIVIRAEDLLLVLVTLTWLAKMAIKKLPLLIRSPLNVPIGLYTAAIFTSTIYGMLIGAVQPLRGAFYVLKLIEYFFLYFIVLNQIVTVKQVKTFTTVLLFTAIIVGIYGNTHIGHVARISAPFEGEGEPNTLGGYMLFILCMVAGLFFYYKTRRTILILIFAFLVPTFLFTLSRASYLGMIFSLIAFVLITRDKRVVNFSIAMFLLFALAVGVGPPALKDRVIGAFMPEKSQQLQRVGVISLGPSPAARIMSWKMALTKLFPKSPILGFGVTGTPFLDSQYILVLSETGLIGLILFSWLFLKIWKVGMKSFRDVETPLFKGLVLGYLVGMIGLLFHAIGSNSFIIIRIAEPFWFFTAIVMKSKDIESGKAEEESAFGTKQIFA
ncbi:MAG: O-antigen ligase family protein [Candidatus Omnitrophica bacterium]|nr:O-antigen ligase family protein [Candidatus Omnitrophota bacterium]